MALEVPLITIAEQMSAAVTDLTCSQIYQEKFNIDQNEELCSPNSQFNFEDAFKSSFAMTNIYLYNDKFNPTIYQDFLQLTQMTSEEFT